MSDTLPNHSENKITEDFFAKRIDRAGTFSFKWEKYKGTDILPMWVADTEFRIAPAIAAALHANVEHGVLGYHLPVQHTPANDAVVHWCQQQYGWTIDPKWIVWTPGVCPAFNMAVKAFSAPGSNVLVQSPNYPPLLAAPKNQGCHAVHIPTHEAAGRWMIDFVALEQAAKNDATKLFIMCNPMNPVGSVLSQEQLDRVAKICRENDVILCSDEIHCDLILDDIPHLPAGSHSQLRDHSITLMAANKTFNVAGLGASFAIIPNAKLRTQFTQAAQGMVPWVTIMGLIATEAAFTRCDEWLQAQKAYLKANRDHLVSAINGIPGLTAKAPQATFLLWVDASGLGVENVQKWAEAKGVGPSPGIDFGNDQFFRLNYGVSREMLDEVIARLSA